MKKRAFLMLFLVIHGITGYGQQTFPENALTYLSRLEKYNKIMGVVAVSKDHQLQLNKAIGYADAEHQLKLQADTKFRVGSISKMFTSVLVLKAVEEHKIGLNDKLSAYFPEIPHADSITIEYMLRHRSGIYSVTNEADYFEWCTSPKTRKELIDIIVRNKPVFEPDTKAAYSNSNFILLTFILEDIYGKKYRELLAEKITRPLGLTNTYVGAKIDLANNEAYSYSFEEKWEKEKETDMSIPQGAGAVVSNTHDLITFIEALFDGKLITPEHLENMTDIRDRYGLGMFKFPFDDKTAFGHGGGIDGFVSMLAYYPKEKMAFCFLTNGFNYNKNTLSITILNYAFGLPQELPDFEIVPVGKSILESYTGEYTSEEFPEKTTILLQEEQLMIQVAGQEAFPLEAVAETKFKNDLLGLLLEFDAKEHTFVLKQGGRSYLFKR